jgi:hypothetical protein
MGVMVGRRAIGNDHQSDTPSVSHSSGAGQTTRLGIDRRGEARGAFDIAGLVRKLQAGLGRLRSELPLMRVVLLGSGRREPRRSPRRGPARGLPWRAGAGRVRGREARARSAGLRASHLTEGGKYAAARETVGCITRSRVTVFEIQSGPHPLCPEDPRRCHPSLSGPTLTEAKALGDGVPDREVDFGWRLSLWLRLVWTRACWRFASQTATLRVTETAQ